MNKSLVIVESPAKAKTLNRYLGGDYQVLATYGHVRDLLPKSGAVDTEKDFAMKYE
ncbi:MAG: toprim domain-containing protein, partial [Gammaproteobacteria bacterium]